jgi:hypothetical protein
MSGSGTRRTEDFHTLRTRQLILQNQDGTYPTSGGVLFFNSANGTVGDSGINVDSGGNINIVQNITVTGTSTFDGGLEVLGVSSLNTVNISGSASILEQTTLNNVEASGSLQVIGPTILTSLDVTNALQVTGSTTLASLDVSGYLKIPVNTSTSGVIQQLRDLGENTTTANSILVQGTGNVTCSVNSNTLTVYGAGGGGGDESGMNVYGYITWDGSGNTTFPITASAPISTLRLGMVNPSPIVQYITVAPYTKLTFNGTPMDAGDTIICDNSLSAIPTTFRNTINVLVITSWYVYRYNAAGIPLDSSYYMGAINSVQNIAYTVSIVGVASGTSTDGYNLSYTKDGSNWIPVRAFEDGSANKIVYNNGTWVVVGTGDAGGHNVWYARNDASGWKSLPAFSQGGATDAVYSNGTWVIIGTGDTNGNNIWYSTTNGSTWISRNAFVEGASTNAVYGNGKWVVTGYGGVGKENILIYNTDLLSWSSYTTFTNANKAVYGQEINMWVFTGTGGTISNILYEQNGVSGSVVGAFVSGTSEHAVYANNRFVVTGVGDISGNIWCGECVESVFWTQGHAYISSTTSKAAVYGGINTWVVPGTGGIWYSTDNGASWSPVTFEVMIGSDPRTVNAFTGGESTDAVYGNFTWVVTGRNATYDDNIWYSPNNGVSWNPTFTPMRANKAVYGPELNTWVVTGTGDLLGNIWWNDGGWDYVPGFIGGAAEHAVYADSRFVVTGYGDSNGNVWYGYVSDEAPFWNQINAYSSNTTDSKAAVYGNIWVVPGSGDSNGNNLWYTNNNSTFLSRNAFQSGSSMNAVYSNGTWVVVGTGGTSDQNIWVSTDDGLNFSPISNSPTLNSFPGSDSKIVSRGDLWCITGSSVNNKNLIVSSDNGITWTQITSFTGGRSNDVVFLPL